MKRNQHRKPTAPLKFLLDGKKGSKERFNSQLPKKAIQRSVIARLELEDREYYLHVTKGYRSFRT